MTPRRIVIVGAGQAGGRCAEALRAAGHAGETVLVGEEPHAPYERPPLTKEFLAGEMPYDKLLLRPAGWYADHGVTLLPGRRARALDRALCLVRLDDGQRLGYDAVVLATGSRPRRLAVPGADLPGVCVLRSVEDSRALRERLAPGRRLVIVGAGLIGLEVAAAARAAGCAVTVVEAAPLPMSRVAPAEAGAHCLALHRAHGVEMRMASGVRRIDARGAALALTLDTGETIGADTVVVGIGVVPNVELAAEAGLAAANGIEVDEYGRTADPRVHAIGDCAAFHHPGLGRRLRLEQWQHAQNHAVAVARSLVGPPQPYAELPWAWSTQYGLRMQFVGAPASWDRAVWRGDPAAGRAMLFCLHEGALVAACGFDAAREMRLVRRLVERRAIVPPADLQDPGLAIEDIVQAAAPA